MKKRLSITIEETLLNEVKKIASKQKTSISKIVEDYFKSLTKRKRKTLSEILNELPKPKLADNFNWKDEYYKAKMKKYGL